MTKPSASSPYQLLVEGRDDQWTIINLLTRHGYDWDDAGVDRPFVKDCRGFENLITQLPVVAKSSCSRLGVVVDADLDGYAHWDSVFHAVTSSGIDLPRQPEPAGTIVRRTHLPVRVGIWMMPNNAHVGKLEDFIARLVPGGDPCWSCAQEATTEARLLGAPLKPNDQSKGEIHTWLAWREDPGVPFGVALTAKMLAHDSPEAMQFVAWFRGLFGD